MDATTVAAWLSLMGFFVAGVFTLFGKKIRGPEDAATQRRDTIADRDGLINKLNERIDDLEDRVEKTETEIREVRTINEKLKAALYRVLGIMREHGLLHLLKSGDIPDDIHY